MNKKGTISHFFAYLSRMRLIRRWGLMYNIHPENIQEHSLQVCFIAHTLALVKNKLYGGEVDPSRTAVLAMYHDVSEVITGDLPTPIKYFNPEINNAYKEIESVAHDRLWGLLPEDLKGDFKSIFFEEGTDKAHWELVKAADKIAAYLKCQEELKAGNHEFSHAQKVILRTIRGLDMPEVRYFMETFCPSISLTLDELQ